MIPASDPWAEDPANVAAASKAVIRNAHRRASDARDALPRLRKDLDRFLEDLDAIAGFYEADISAYRRHRPLTAVHLPSIIACLETLADRMSDERFADLQDEVRGCLVATRDVRHSLEEAARQPLQTEVAVLKESLPAPDIEAEDNAPSRWARFGSALTTRAGSSLKPVTERLPEMPDVGGMYESLSNRAAGGTEAVRTYAVGIVEDGFDRVRSPIVGQIAALQHGLLHGAVSGLIAGGLVAIVFPPAAPIAAGIVFLGDGGSAYAMNAEKGSQAAAAERSERQRKRQDEMKRSLAKFAGKSPVVRMETPYVHVQMNIEDDTASGMILAGRHAGAALSDLHANEIDLLARTAPDTETADILKAWNTRTS